MPWSPGVLRPALSVRLLRREAHPTGLQRALHSRASPEAEHMSAGQPGLSRQLAHTAPGARDPRPPSASESGSATTRLSGMVGPRTLLLNGHKAAASSAHTGPTKSPSAFRRQARKTRRGSLALTVSRTRTRPPGPRVPFSSVHPAPHLDDEGPRPITTEDEPPCVLLAETWRRGFAALGSGSPAPRGEERRGGCLGRRALPSVKMATSAVSLTGTRRLAREVSCVGPRSESGNHFKFRRRPAAGLPLLQGGTLEPLLGPVRKLERRRRGARPCCSRSAGVRVASPAAVSSPELPGEPRWAGQVAGRASGERGMGDGAHTACRW